MLGLGLSHMGGYNSDAVVAAAKEGIRLFDTAARYGNEEQVHILDRMFLYSISTDFSTQFACWLHVPAVVPRFVPDGWTKAGRGLPYHKAVAG
jgi:hypothetical protein